MYTYTERKPVHVSLGIFVYNLHVWLKPESELKNKDNEKTERKENWNKTEHGLKSFWITHDTMTINKNKEVEIK